MDIPYQYTYLLMGLLFLAGWLFLYMKRRDERKELLAISFIFCILGVVSDYLYVKDWWRPETILGGAPFSGETLLAAFGIMGISAVLPEYILRLKTTPPQKVFSRPKLISLFLLLAFLLALFYSSYYLLHTSSLAASIFVIAVPTAFMWGRRLDLVKVAAINGILLVGIASLVYTALNFITPGWIDRFYLFQNTPDTLILSLPIDDLLFYFFIGIFSGTFYEWWQRVERIPLKRKGK